MKTAIISVALLGLFLIIGGTIAAVMYIAPLVKQVRAEHQAGHYTEKARARLLVQDEKDRDYKGAIEDYDKAIAAKPSAKLYDERAECRQHINDMQGARDDLDKSIALNPKNPATYGMRGFVTISLGNYAEGIEDFNKALALAPQDGEIFRGRGMAEYCMDNNTAALKDYQRAFSYASEGENASYAQYFIWCTQVKLGNAVEATKALTTYMDTPGAKKSPGWTRAVGEFLIDEKTEKELLAIADVTPETGSVVNQRCEAYYYMALKRLAKNDKAGAKEALQQCIDTNVFLFLEYEMARADIKRI
ncbi:MAG: hypothetical protein ACAI35_05680 [Candidatus Methylacidiphilales bacterium]|nr:hypothetical protein [Candidatus Methylacidiphilales bacterium]